LEVYSNRINGLAELERMKGLMAKYRDTPMDLADATLITAAESLNETTVFTFDHHFRIYQLNDRTPVNVVP
jgi:predicted nucleic acid-binding protein